MSKTLQGPPGYKASQVPHILFAERAVDLLGLLSSKELIIREARELRNKEKRSGMAA